MNEWAVVTVIVTLAGFIIAIVTPLVKLNTTITYMKTTVKTLEKEMETLTQRTTQEHDQLWKSKEKADKQLVDLRIRIAVLEKVQKKCGALRQNVETE